MSLEGWILLGVLVFLMLVDVVLHYIMRKEVRDLREELFEEQDEPQNTTAIGFFAPLQTESKDE